MPHTVEWVEEQIRAGFTVRASIAPSFPAAFSGAAPGQVFAAVKKLGFESVQETASAIPPVIERAQQVLQRKGSCISCSCPRIRELIRREYTSLERWLVKAPSPMAMHAVKLRQMAPGGSSPGTVVVFFGPCTYKRKDPAVKMGLVDAVLTFQDLKEWMSARGISPEHTSPQGLDPSTPPWARSAVLVPGVNGLTRCVDFLRDVLSRNRSSGPPRGNWELHLCEGGCLGGPGLGTDIPISQRRKAVFDAVWNSPSERGQIK